MTLPSEFSKQLEKAMLCRDWEMLDTLLVDERVNQLDISEKENIAQVFLEQEECLLQTANEPSHMAKAYSILEKCLRLDVPSEKSWVKFAEAHLKLAFLHDDQELFDKANKLFGEAECLYKSRGHKMPLHVIARWGACLYAIAKESEEAHDLKLAIAKFKEAYEGGFETGALLADYGTALGEMGMLIGHIDYLQEAVLLLERYLKSEGDKDEVWFKLACIYKILYLSTSDVGFFEKADQSFCSAARLLSNEAAKSKIALELFVNWGQLLVFEGKVAQDPDLLSQAIDKLLLVDLQGEESSAVLAILGDAFVHLGIYEEKFDHFIEAKNCLETILKSYPNHPEALNFLAFCFCQMGKYLSDPKYIHQGIEKYQIGISQNKNSYHYWHGLSMANFNLGELSDDPDLFEKAARFCSEAIRLGGNLPAYWNDWGVALMKLGEITNDVHPIHEAIEKFEEAIAVYNKKAMGPPDPDWFYNYACALDWLGGHELNPHYFERAISILSRLLEQHPDCHHIRYNLALSCFHLGDCVGDVNFLEKSIEQFELFLKEESEDDGAIADLGLVFLTLADLLAENIVNERSISNFLKAEHFLTYAIALGNTRANYYLACLHALQNKPDEAVCFLLRAQANGTLPSKDLLSEDEWLDPIRSSQQFISFLNKV